MPLPTAPSEHAIADTIEVMPERELTDNKSPDPALLKSTLQVAHMAQYAMYA
jgi:hypothetical protein